MVLIALAVALTFNVTDALQRAIPDYTSSLNQALDHAGSGSPALGPRQKAALAACSQSPSLALADCGPARRSRASSSGSTRRAASR